MKTVLLGAVAAAFAMMSAQVAAAQDAAPSNMTIELGLTRANVSEAYDINYNVLTARAGMKFNTYFGAEIEAGFGLGEQDVTIASYDFDTKLDWVAGAFVTAQYPVSEDLTVVGRLGFAKTQISADWAYFEETVSGKGIAGGVGLRYFPNGGPNGVRVDYTKFKVEDGDVDAASVTFVRKF